MNVAVILKNHDTGSGKSGGWRLENQFSVHDGNAHLWQIRRFQYFVLRRQEFNVSIDDD